MILAGCHSPVRIDELLTAGTTRSFEFFPPKSDEESTVLEASLLELEQLQPSFVSVTYRGGHESRQRTFDLVTRIEQGGRITVARLDDGSDIGCGAFINTAGASGARDLAAANDQMRAVRPKVVLRDPAGE